MKNNQIKYRVSLDHNFVGRLIDHLRISGNDHLADELQFGEDGDERDELNGRCRLCCTLQAGDTPHRCWVEEEKRFCLECEGELERLDNQTSHTNPRTCIRNLREKIEWYRSELEEERRTVDWSNIKENTI